MPKRKQDYDVERFCNLVTPLLKAGKESQRQASLSAGLDETALSGYFRGVQPMRDTCIMLADHFGINPNEILEAAGYEPLRFFDRRMINSEAFPPAIDQLTSEIMRIGSEEVRQEIVEVLRRILRIQLEMIEGI